LKISSSKSLFRPLNSSKLYIALLPWIMIRLYKIIHET
jgi:hypothetical protein